MGDPAFSFSSDKMIPREWWTWKFITPQEWACHGDGSLLVVPAFMDKLELLRAQTNIPLRFTSAYRSPQYNLQVAESGLSGPHTTGRACDLHVVSGMEAGKLIDAAMGLGFTGIGVKVCGPPAGWFVHCDDVHPALTVWSY